jgi:2-polyprenyl-3-methyl-5-hydroxy-6-metoxy-1,4-benzoquinol methylase
MSDQHAAETKHENPEFGQQDIIVAGEVLEHIRDPHAIQSAC